MEYIQGEVPGVVFTPIYHGSLLTLSHCTSLGPYFIEFWLHVSRIPQSSTAHPYFRVADPQGIPSCRDRSRVKQFKCKRAGQYFPGLPLGIRVVWKGLVGTCHPYKVLLKVWSDAKIGWLWSSAVPNSSNAEHEMESGGVCSCNLADFLLCVVFL